VTLRDSARLLQAGSGALATLLCVLLTGCTEPTATDADGPENASAPETAIAPPSPLQMARWTRNCALCHVRGEGGAPVLGDREAWAERSAKGEDVLLAHTLEGFNNMPPLGYCMDCEEADFRVLIRFMEGEH